MKNETYIITGKTVEEAMAAARSQYGTSDNELSFEILEMPVKGFLGFGVKPAKVKVTVSKSLEDVNLSDLVSELKSMKITTDPDNDGAQEKKSAPKNQLHQPKKQNQNTAQQKQNQPRQPQQNQPKKQPQQNTAQNQPKPRQEQKKADPKPTVAEIKEVKAEAAAAKAESKPTPAEIKEVKAEAAAAKAEVKENPAEAAAAKAEIDESDLPAALRKPAHKNQTQQKKNQKKPAGKSAPRAQDSKSGEEKKKDLLSAVMGVADAPKKADSPAVTVTPTVMKPKDAPAAEEKPAAPVMEDVSELVKPTRSVSEAVDAALAAFAAQEPAALPEGAGEMEESREIPVEFVSPEKLQLALNFINTLLKNMHLEAEAVAASTGAEVPGEGLVEARVEITGKDTGLLIGHHGETLDAIQTLMNLSANRRDSEGRRDYVKIVLDMADYRRKREDTLRALARRTAARVVKYKRNIVLEPMNPYERRVIHSELHNVENVSTHSVGSDENRKIVITYEGADKQVRKPRTDRRRRGEKGDAHESRERAPRGEKSERPARQPKPVRAKSIDEVQIDLSEESDKTFGSILMDEGIETGVDPIEEIARADEAKEESLREY